MIVRFLPKRKRLHASSSIKIYMFSIVNVKVLNTSIYDVEENNNITPGSGMADGGTGMGIAGAFVL